jgi:hypothetical protein
MSVTRSRVSGGHGEHFAAERRDREYRHVRRPPNDPGADGHDAVVGRPEFAFARGATWLSQLRVLIGPDQLDCQRNMSAGTHAGMRRDVRSLSVAVESARSSISSFSATRCFGHEMTLKPACRVGAFHSGVHALKFSVPLNIFPDTGSRFPCSQTIGNLAGTIEFTH